MRLSAVRLGSVAEIEREGVDPQTIQSGTTYVGLEHISGDGSFIEPPKVQPGELGSTKFAFSERHILFGKLRPYLRKVARPTFSGICSTDIIPISPSPKIDRNYLFHYLRTDAVIDRATSMASGANLPRINPKHLIDFEVPLPLLDEQRRIAAILDQADALRQKRRQTLAYLDNLIQASFIKLFGDPLTNPLGWEIRHLGEVGTLERGISKHRPRNDPALLGGPYPLIQTGDVANADGYVREFRSTYSEMGLQQSRLWPRGTLCITIAANIGEAAILTFDACFPDSVVGFVPSNAATTEYVQRWMKFIQRNLEENAPQSAQKNINLAILRNLSIPVPPRSLQEQFTQIVSHIDELRSHQKLQMKQLDALFASLQHRAFRGEL